MPEGWEEERETVMGKPWWRKSYLKKELLTENASHKWCHQVVLWRVEWDRRTQSRLLPGTQDEAPHSTVWPAGPGPSATLKGTTRTDFSSAHDSRFCSSILVPLINLIPHGGHFKLVLYSWWDWGTHQELCMNNRVGIIISHIPSWNMYKTPLGLMNLEIYGLIF